MSIKLKVYSSGMGSTVFLGRLSEHLEQHFAVKIVDKKEDIYLSSVWEGPGKYRKAIWVHRVDGVYFDLGKSGRTGMNNKIKNVIKRCDAVVYQSKFSRKISRGVLRISKKRSTIIYNGCDPSIYSGVTHDKFGYDKMLIACAKWHPLKRPRSIIRGFIKASLNDTVLVMIGRIEKKDCVRHPNVRYVGQLKPSNVRDYYACCDGVVHISRLDACPNAVVEALCAGKPVLGNNVGGTPELIKGDGVILNIDPPCTYKSFKMGNPDKVPPKRVAMGIRKLMSCEWHVNRQDLHIGNIAKQYYDYFCKLMSK